MAAQSLKTFRFLLAHPGEWHSTQSIAQALNENLKGMSATVSYITRFLMETEPGSLKIQLKGHRREIMSLHVTDDVDTWSQDYNKRYLKWHNALIKSQREKKKSEPEISNVPLEIDISELKKSVAQTLGQELTIRLDGTIRVLFGLLPRKEDTNGR